MKAILVAVAAIAFATVPFAVPFDGFDPALYPEPQIDPPVQPAGYAFGIWGPIYLWLLAHAFFGLVRRADDTVWDRTRWPLLVSLIIGAAWLPAAQVSPLAATAMIYVMLVSALLALFRTPPEADRWLLRAPLALYAGWLTAAAWVAWGLVGAGYGVALDEIGWAWVALAAALGMALLVIRGLGQAPFYAAAVVWALVAVAVSNWGALWGLVGLALVGAVAVAGFAAYRMRAL